MNSMQLAGFFFVICRDQNPKGVFASIKTARKTLFVLSNTG